jgi:hypothetical protein
MLGIETVQRFACFCLVTCAIGWAGGLDPKDEAFIGKRRDYWAFRKPVRPDVPSIRSPWVRTPIDAFLLEAMRAKGVTPSPALDRARLLRRVTLDLTGLPPTPGELDAFLRDRSGHAYETAVDRLLASPQYGERWAMRWLDVVRYADTNGYEVDAERLHAWRYRDYVVRSFNADKPYDKFIKEQIAGDELYPGDHDALIATGFHRAGPIHLVAGNQDKEMNRQEVLTEMSDAVGSVFLGLTIGCARCRNHKFDPVLQADYYRIQAIFAATAGKDIEIAAAAEKSAYEVANKEYEGRFNPVREQIAEIEKPVREQIRAEKTAALEPPLREALETPFEKRSEGQKQLAKDAKERVQPTWDEVLARLTPAERERRAELRRRLHQIELTRPDPPASAFAVANMDKAPDAFVLRLGDPRSRVAPVEPGVITVLDSGIAIPRTAAGRRSALANWLASPENPLTARVMANRIWQLRMGSGLVATPNDFGVLGQRPTNQKLLDWLATELLARKGSVKAIDRTIVLSSAYRQISASSPAKAALDPDNKLYWHMNRRRLDGESIRDEVLAVSGELNARIGGNRFAFPSRRKCTT